LGMFDDRAIPRINHIPHPNARKISRDSDKTFGNCYKSIANSRAYECMPVLQPLLISSDADVGNPLQAILNRWCEPRSRSRKKSDGFFIWNSGHSGHRIPGAPYPSLLGALDHALGQASGAESCLCYCKFQENVIVLLTAAVNTATAQRQYLNSGRSIENCNENCASLAVLIFPLP